MNELSLHLAKRRNGVVVMSIVEVMRYSSVTHLLTVPYIWPNLLGG